MQPYLFPYIGYYKMVFNSDIFVSYDNVDYIQRGWINRNRIMINNEEKYFTLPCDKSSLGTKINDVKISNYKDFSSKFLKTIYFNYSKAPFFESTYSLLEQILLMKDYEYISEISFCSIDKLLKKFKFNGEVHIASELNIESENQTKEERLETYLKHFNSKSIILPSGSIDLYNNWSPKEVKKLTLEHNDFEYNHFKNIRTKNLSIIDVLMFNDEKTVLNHLNDISFI